MTYVPQAEYPAVVVEETSPQTFTVKYGDDPVLGKNLTVSEHGLVLVERRDHDDGCDDTARGLGDDGDGVAPAASAPRARGVARARRRRDARQPGSKLPAGGDGGGGGGKGKGRLDPDAKAGSKWRVQHDRASGKTYYWHTRTLKVQWHMPMELQQHTPTISSVQPAPSAALGTVNDDAAVSGGTFKDEGAAPSSSETPSSSRAAGTEGTRSLAFRSPSHSPTHDNTWDDCTNSPAQAASLQRRGIQSTYLELHGRGSRQATFWKAALAAGGKTINLSVRTSWC